MEGLIPWQQLEFGSSRSTAVRRPYPLGGAAGSLCAPDNLSDPGGGSALRTVPFRRLPIRDDDPELPRLGMGLFEGIG